MGPARPAPGRQGSGDLNGIGFGGRQVPRGHSRPAILPASPSAVALGQLERQE